MKVGETKYFGPVGVCRLADGDVQISIIGEGIVSFTDISPDEATEVWMAIRDASSPDGVWEE